MEQEVEIKFLRKENQELKEQNKNNNKAFKEKVNPTLFNCIRFKSSLRARTFLKETKST